MTLQSSLNLPKPPVAIGFLAANDTMRQFYSGRKAEFDAK